MEQSCPSATITCWGKPHLHSQGSRHLRDLHESGHDPAVLEDFTHGLFGIVCPLLNAVKSFALQFSASKSSWFQPVILLGFSSTRKWASSLQCKETFFPGCSWTRLNRQRAHRGTCPVSVVLLEFVQRQDSYPTVSEAPVV